MYDLLIVDDDPTVIVVLGAMLRPLGHVRFAKRGADALRLARQAVPDLVLLDLQLPDMPGLAVCDAMAASPLLAEVPVIALSGGGEGIVPATAISHGAREFLAKPPQAELVLPCVRRHLEASLKEATAPRARGSTRSRGSCNRRRFDALLTLECARASAGGEPVALLRAIAAPAAARGAAGDPGEQAEALAALVHRVARRPGDRIGHLGPEGLALLLPETGRDGAVRLAHQLLALAEHDARVGPLHVGIATWVPAVLQLDAEVPSGAGLLAAAGQALLAARGAGAGPVCDMAYLPELGAGRTLPRGGVGSR